MSLATTAATPQGRKRRRHQRRRPAADGNSSAPVAMLPRVATAPPADPARSPRCGAAATGTRAKTAGTENPRPSSPEFADTADLDAQISTLASIRAYGYGAVPGTPLRRPRGRHAVHGARELATASGTAVESDTTIGSGIIGCSTPTGTAKVGRGEHQTKTRARGDSARTNREPWMGPLDRGVSLQTVVEGRGPNETSITISITRGLVLVKSIVQLCHVYSIVRVTLQG